VRVEVHERDAGAAEPAPRTAYASQAAAVVVSRRARSRQSCTPCARGGAGGAGGDLLTPRICRAPKAAGAAAKPGLAALRAVCDEETAGKRKAPAANPFVRKPKAAKA